MDWNLAIAGYAAVVSTILLLVKVSEFSDAQPGLELSISTGIAIGLSEMLMGTDHAVQLTVANTGGRPLGVSSLGLGLTDGRYIPVFQPSPVDGNTKLPAILEPQQSATVFLDHHGLERSLREEGVGLKEIVANMTDGTKRTKPVPDGWRMRAA